MRIRCASAIIAVLALISFLTACSNNQGGDVIDVFAEDFGEHMVSKYVTCSGTVEMSSSLPYVVSAEISSYRIKKLYVAVGDRVKEGDKICEFDTAYIESKVAELEKQTSAFQKIDEKTFSNLKEQLESSKQLQAIKLDQINQKISEARQKMDDADNSYNDAQNKYNSALDSYNEAESNLRDSTDLEKIEYYSGLCTAYQAQVTAFGGEMSQWSSVISSSQSELNSLQYEYNMTKVETDKEINDLQYQIDTYKSGDETKKELENLKQTLADSVVYSKYSGIVSEIMVGEGQVCNDKNILNIVDDNNKLVHVTLNDNEMLSVEEGMPVKIAAATDALDEIGGEIYKINKIKGENGFDVYIKSDDLEKLGIGMTVTNNIVLFENNTLSVAKDALRQRDDESYYVLAAVRSGDRYVLEEKDVTIGVESADYVEITSSDITPGEKIIIMNNANLRAGMAVNPIEKKDEG